LATGKVEAPAVSDVCRKIPRADVGALTGLCSDQYRRFDVVFLITSIINDLPALLNWKYEWSLSHERGKQRKQRVTYRSFQTGR